MTEYLNEHGQLHRLDGPAIIHLNGAQQWWAHGQLHRTDGPSRVWPNGTQEWHYNGKRHRTDGPAVLLANGYCEWWFNGRQVDRLTHMLLVNQQNTQTQTQQAVI